MMRSLPVLAAAALFLAAAPSGPSPNSQRSGEAVAEALKQAYRRPAAVPFPADNPHTRARESLGEALFFDPRLSSADAVSCASCHDPAQSWSDGRSHRMAPADPPMSRRTPTILNLAWGDRFFWDGRADDLEAQALQPITSPTEMNQSLEATVAKLGRVEGYERLFQAAYPGEGITPTTIAKALATFERTVVSGPAPFDAWLAGDPRAIPEAAVRGFLLFNAKANCAACHSGWNFSDGSFHDIGLPSPDRGRGALVPLLIMQHAFKTPTLRDVARRPPYMHDGSVPTLLDVVELYDRGGEARPSRSKEIQPLHLSAQDKADLIAFLETLTSPGAWGPAPALPR